MNIAQFVALPGEILGEQEIVVFGARRRTYGELLGRVRRLAAALQARGASRGACVAALGTNSDCYVEALYATAAAGATFTPLNYRAKRHELAHMLRQSAPVVLFVESRYRALLEDALAEAAIAPVLVALDAGASGLADSESWIAATEPAEIADVEEEDVAVLMYTSGTTSLPKGVLLRHGDFSTYVMGTVEMADGEPRGAALVSVPLYHIAGLTSLLTTLWTGRRLVLLPQFDAPQWLATVAAEQITHAFVVPTMVRRLLDAPEFDPVALGTLESLAYGGAPMPFPVIRRALEAFPASCGFVNAFGQTETTSTLTVLGPEDHRLTGDPARDESVLRRLRSIGRPLPDVELEIVDDTGATVPPGTVGELVVRTARAMKGYAGDVEGGARREPDGFLHTRDLGWIDDEGYVFLAGRKDDMIIRGGENIAPAEIESVLAAHPAVEEVAVVGVPSEEWGETVAAAIVLRAGASATSDEIMEYVRARVASFKKPERVGFFVELPRNALGKLLRNELRERLVEG